jgi:hypothetical protein
MRFAQCFPERSGVAEISGRENDPVRRFPCQLLEQLEDDGFLTLDTKWVDGVQEIHAQLLARLLDQAKTIIEVASHQQCFGAIGERLRQLSCAHAL